MIFTLRRSNSGLILAMYPSSVVQTGVKSFGCEKSTAHESPIHSWKRSSPSVVCAVKSGAVSLIVSPIPPPSGAEAPRFGRTRFPRARVSCSPRRVNATRPSIVPLVRTPDERGAPPSDLRKTDGLGDDDDRGLGPQRHDTGEGNEPAATSRGRGQVGELAQ